MVDIGTYALYQAELLRMEMMKSQRRNRLSTDKTHWLPSRVTEAWEGSFVQGQVGALLEGFVSSSFLTLLFLSFHLSVLLLSAPPPHKKALSIKWQICDIRRKECLFSENPSTIQWECSLANLDDTSICNPNTVDRGMQNYGGPGLGHGSTPWGKWRRRPLQQHGISSW